MAMLVRVHACANHHYHEVPKDVITVFSRTPLSNVHVVHVRYDIISDGVTSWHVHYGWSYVRVTLVALTNDQGRTLPLGNGLP